ncbi:PAS domain-containing protein [Octadecabacter antarcticus 307]|uniref:PAS domain-containing protein n=1 Tax=Octadecabacter antarcticus 307 TaxID=391626 RepID=M9RK01_9RHOB|nr:PAS-domain containing protein [Octadecabacter antarcticus]AGI70165.1 PAS domain-containing protein [Octadecabacter antarcticus 307]
MSQLAFLGATGALILGALAAVGMMSIWIRTNSKTEVTARTLIREAEDSITFLFEDETLSDATPLARDLMEFREAHRSDWENFLALLSSRFPHLRSKCGDLATVGKKKIKPADGQNGWIEAEFWNGMARITLVQDQDHPDETIHPLTATAMEHELETLRSIGEDSPQLIWKHDAEGVLIWANRSYMELSEILHAIGPNDVLPWPPREVFNQTARPVGAAPVIDMHRVDTPDQEKPIWFEITSLKRGTDTIHFAIDASAVVFARDAQRSFVQTLTKTFAQLSVGLVIFDSDRRLVLFNPALVDLTLLPTNFLIARPTLFSFLDRLRDNQMIPEPKDYASWRDQMVALESAATEGNYHETWPLPNGQTFRVTGKPHPNGAIAFLFEDISDEISLTRKFRSQIDISAAVIDNLASAVAVFSSSGSLVLANSAYRSLWGTQSEDAISSRDFLEELQIWQTTSAPSPVWVKLQETITRGRSDTPWDGSVWLDSHVEIVCRYSPLPDGNHQITFTPSERESGSASKVETVIFRPSQSMSV